MMIVMYLNVLLSYFILDDENVDGSGGSYYNHCSYSSGSVHVRKIVFREQS